MIRDLPTPFPAGHYSSSTESGDKGVKERYLNREGGFSSLTEPDPAFPGSCFMLIQMFFACRKRIK
jgi:hypothetical protein